MLCVLWLVSAKDHFYMGFWHVTHIQMHQITSLLFSIEKWAPSMYWRLFSRISFLWLIPQGKIGLFEINSSVTSEQLLILWKVWEASGVEFYWFYWFCFVSQVVQIFRLMVDKHLESISKSLIAYKVMSSKRC